MAVSSSGNAAAGPGQSHRIDVALRDVSQLFDSLDPSPFMEKDLNPNAEEFIVSWAHELPVDAPVTLRVYLDQWPDEDPVELIRQAVHNNFAHRAELTRLEFRRLMRQGRTSLLIGSGFLASCLLVIKTLLHSEASTWAGVAREGLTIAGWVAMWRPMQIYLYDWWPVRRRGRIYAKLSHMPVEVLPHGKQ
jgi:hypothetical protein